MLGSFITFRRFHLDRLLSLHHRHLNGRVLDIGGKKSKGRGKFKIDPNSLLSIHYINIDLTCRPDVIGDASHLPMPSATYDTVMLCEVLEHVDSPEVVVGEISRILKPQGRLVMSMPFLYGIHADPYDFQRWTDKKISKVLNSYGLEIETLECMGGLFAVTFDLAFNAIGKSGSRLSLIKRLLRKLLRTGVPFIKLLDWLFIESSRTVTGGYFVVAKKEVRATAALFADFPKE